MWYLLLMNVVLLVLDVPYLEPGLSLVLLFLLGIHSSASFLPNSYRHCWINMF